MVEHICKRCGYTTKVITSLRIHLNRITPCIVTDLDIAREELLLELPFRIVRVKEKTYDCNKCGQKFNHPSNKSRHQKICTNNIITISLKDELKHIKDQVILLKSIQLLIDSISYLDKKQVKKRFIDQVDND